jgi:hypothetical protein
MLEYQGRREEASTPVASDGMLAFLRTHLV